MVSLPIELPEALVKQLEEKGLLNDSAFFIEVIQHAMNERQKASAYTKEETLAAIEATYGLSADEDWTMDDILKMKREEWEIEERKLNRL